MLSHLSSSPAPSAFAKTSTHGYYAPARSSAAATAQGVTNTSAGATTTTRGTATKPATASMSFRYYQPPRPAPRAADSDSDDDGSDSGATVARKNSRGTNGSGSAQGKRGACTHCKSLKVKCHFSPPSADGTVPQTCQRCALHKLQCIVNGRKKRRAVATHEELLLKSHKQDMEIAALLRALDARLADQRVDAWIARASELSRVGPGGGGPGGGWAGGSDDSKSSSASSSGSSRKSGSSEGRSSSVSSGAGSPGMVPYHLHGETPGVNTPSRRGPLGYAVPQQTPLPASGPRGIRYTTQDLLAYFPDVGVADPSLVSPPDIVARGLIEPGDVHELFEIYFRFINPYFPLLDAELHTADRLFWHSHFLFTLIVCVATKHSPKHATLVPLYVAFARDAGARAAVAAGTPSSTSPGQRFSSNGSMSFGLGFNAASGHGHSGSSGASVMLTSRPAAQAFLIQAAHQMPRRRFEDSRTWLFLGIALAMVQALHLEEEGYRAVARVANSKTFRGSPDVADAEDGASEVFFEHEDGHRSVLPTSALRARWRADAGRTWLMAYSLDASAAAQLGKPTVLERDAALARRAGEWCRAWTDSPAGMDGVNLPADLLVAALADSARVIREWKAEVGRLEAEEADAEGTFGVKCGAAIVKVEENVVDSVADAEKLKDAKTRKCELGSARVLKMLDCVWRCHRALCDSRKMWSDRFEEDGLIHDEMYAYRVYSALMTNAFGRLVILFFGLQRALNENRHSGTVRLSSDDPLVRECISTAHEVISIVIDGLNRTHLLGYSVVETHFLYVTFAAAHLISLLRPQLRGLLCPGDVRRICTRVRALTRVMDQPNVACDAHGRAAPFTYARYLARLLKIAESDPKLFPDVDRSRRHHLRQRGRATGIGPDGGDGDADADADDDEGDNDADVGADKAEQERPLVVPRDVEAYMNVQPPPPPTTATPHAPAYGYEQDVHMAEAHNQMYPSSYAHSGPMPGHPHANHSINTGIPVQQAARWSPSDLSPISASDAQFAALSSVPGQGGTTPMALDFSFERFLENVGSGSGPGAHNAFSETGMTPPPPTIPPSHIHTAHAHAHTHVAYGQQQQSPGAGSDVDASTLWWGSMVMNAPNAGLSGPGMNGTAHSQSHHGWTNANAHPQNGYPHHTTSHPQAHNAHLNAYGGPDDGGGGYARGY